MSPSSVWRRVVVPAGIVLVLMIAGNAVSTYAAARDGLEFCRQHATEATGEENLSVTDYFFSQGIFSQKMEVRFVTDWIAPDAAFTIEVGRSVFFLPWRIERQGTRIQPEQIISM
jgi:hypothetical protein